MSNTRADNIIDLTCLERVQRALRRSGKKWRFEREEVPGGARVGNRVEDSHEAGYHPMQSHNLLRWNPQPFDIAPSE